MTDAERAQLIASIPEFNAFESHKENIVQKKQGRSAAELASLFAMTDHDRTAYLAEQRAKFRQVLELELDELDDPLEPYVEYIATLERCQTQGPNRELVDVLEEATRRFDDDPMYRSDIRYLVCWTKYARLAQDWQAVFKYLIDKQIGQTHARFYEEYAQIQEENRRYGCILSICKIG
jgi:checkpoint serine/threonine-protein kinase